MIARTLLTDAITTIRSKPWGGLAPFPFLKQNAPLPPMDPPQGGIMRIPSSPILLALAASLLGSATTLPAQGGRPFLVKDFDQLRGTKGLGSLPSFWCKLSNKVLFAATTYEDGRELFVTQGTGESTVLLKDIRPGILSSKPRFFAKLGQFAIFSAENGEDNRELWISDGTALGTRLLFETKAGKGSYLQKGLGTAGGLFYFLLRNAAGVPEVWRTDGTGKGTQRVLQLPPSSNKDPEFFKVAQVKHGVLLPIRNTKNKSLDLFVSDGSQAGTKFLAAIPNLLYLQHDHVLASNGQVALFEGSDLTYGNELWSSDGSPKGTGFFKELAKTKFFHGAPRQFHSWRGKIIFLGYSLWTKSRQLWISDGTTTGTIPLSPVGEMFETLVPEGPYVLMTPSASSPKTKLSFADSNQKVREILFPSKPSFISPWILQIPGGFLLFESNNNPVFWKVDPKTGKASVFLKDVQQAFGSHLYSGTLSYLGLFRKKPDNQEEPFISDGTPQGTKLLKDLFVWKGTLSSQDIAQFPLGDQNLVLVKGSNPVSALWAWKHFPPAPLLLQTTNYPSFLPEAGDRILATPDFSYGFFNFGANLYRLDSQFDGKKPLLIGAPTFGSAGSGDLQTLLHGNLLFSFSPNTQPPMGRELYISDGSTKGTRILKDIRPGSLGSKPQSMRRVGNRVFFVADNGATGLEPWSTDGTPAGTKLLADLWPGRSGSNPSEVTPWDGRVWFTALDSKTLGVYPYFTDPSGSKLQGKLLSPFWPKGFSGASLFAGGPDLLLVYGQLSGSKTSLLFSVKKKGTAYVSQLLLSSSRGFRLVRSLPLGNKSLLFGISSQNYWELWTSDGSPKGTMRLKTLIPAQLSFPEPPPTLRLGTRRILFKLGTRLWQTDGTSGGTHLIDPQGLFQFPRYEQLSNGFLHFVATDRDHGIEPWAWFPGANGNPRGQGCGGSALQTPSLIVDDPVLGSRFRAKGRGAPKGAGGVLLLGVTGSHSAVLPSKAPGGCRLFLDLTRFWVPLAPFVVSASGAWSQGLRAPSDLSFGGKTLLFQALFPLNSGGVTRFETSNGY